MLLDTMVGSKDGVPFAVPGLAELVTTYKDFHGKAVPTFVQAQETDDLLDPKTVAHLALKIGAGLEPPDRVSLTAWDKDRRPWEIPVQDMGKDSCAVLYWEDKVLEPGQKRWLGFAYGIGHITTDPEQKTPPQLALTLDGDFHPGKDFTLLAYVNKPDAEQTVKLTLAPGLTLVKGKAERNVPQPVNSSRAVLTWTLRAEKAGQYEITLTSGKATLHRTLYITTPDPAKVLSKEKIFE
jgi:hypothetical protein